MKAKASPAAVKLRRILLEKDKLTLKYPLTVE